MLLSKDELWRAAEPLYGFLKSKKGGLFTSDIKWNFSKSQLFYRFALTRTLRRESV